MKRLFQLLAMGLVAASFSSCSTAVEDSNYGYVSTSSRLYRGPPHHHHGPYYGSRVYREDVQTVGYPSRGRYITTERHSDMGRSFHRASLDTSVRAGMTAY